MVEVANLAARAELFEQQPAHDERKLRFVIGERNWYEAGVVINPRRVRLTPADGP